jgi:hypothetical protein
MSSLVGLSSAQINRDSSRVRELFTVLHGATFTNLTDSVYFAIIRYRFERLLRDAELSDSLRIMYVRGMAGKDLELERKSQSIFLWRTSTIVAAVMTIITLLVR